MEQMLSTGVQMMQIDISIDNETLCVIRALNTIHFDDLHKIICHKLSISSAYAYSFFLPKFNIIIRRITRSFDVSSYAKIASYVQTGDTIYYHIQNSRFHVRFSSMGVVDETAAMEAKLLVTQGKIKGMMKKETMIPRNQLSQSTQRHLYHLSDILQEEHIFECIPDKSFLMLHIGDMLQPVFVENQQGQFLLYFFQDEENYRRFFCVMKDTLPDQSMYKYKQAVVLRFARKPLTSMQCHRCQDIFASFLDMRRGWEMDGISEEMAQDLLLVLPLLRKAIHQIQLKQLRFSAAQGMLHIYDLPQPDICRVELRRFDAMVLPVLPYENEQNIAALLETDAIATYLEMDYRFVRQPYRGGEHERRAYLLNVSAMGPQMQSHYEHLFEKEQDVRNAFLDMLINIIEENGRPQEIRVKDRYVYSILDDLCAKLKIFVKIKPRLEYLEAYYADNHCIIYEMEQTKRQLIVPDAPREEIKKAVVEQPLQHQYSRKRFKMKGYFN